MKGPEGFHGGFSASPRHRAAIVNASRLDSPKAAVGPVGCECVQRVRLRALWPACVPKAVFSARRVPAACSGRVFADLKAVCSVGCASVVCCVGTVGGCVLRAVCLVGSLGAVRSTHSPNQPQRTQPVPHTLTDRHPKGFQEGFPSLRRLPKAFLFMKGFCSPRQSSQERPP
jgi:hypothetical protein